MGRMEENCETNTRENEADQETDDIEAIKQVTIQQQQQNPRNRERMGVNKKKERYKLDPSREGRGKEKKENYLTERKNKSHQYTP